MPYLIDGNNLWGSWGGPATLRDGRGEVVRRVASFCRGKGARAVIIFDGAPDRHGAERQSMGAVTVQFAPAGRDADSVIRETVDRAAHAGDWTVVTSDKSLYSYCRTRGARVLRAHEWNKESRRAPPASPRASSPATEKPLSESDVEGWLRVFESSTPSTQVDERQPNARTRRKG